MKHAWLLDILGDIKKYSKKNGLPKLAEELAACEALAAIEISENETKNEDDRIVCIYNSHKKQIN
ncbi:hypothetical protein SAMN05444722_3810 [Rhodovulum sp. ES.010]|nr:hypothetical protein SAMN05444722_3810 [Rhodovulum sp. ES.010]